MAEIRRPRLRLRAPSDGYSIKGFFDGSRFGRESVSYTYRYVSPEAIEEYRAKTSPSRAPSGKTVLAAKVELILKSLIDWDVLGERGDTIVEISDKSLSHPFMLTPFLDELVDAAHGYLPERQEEDVKNSVTGSASS